MTSQFNIEYRRGGFEFFCETCSSRSNDFGHRLRACNFDQFTYK